MLFIFRSALWSLAKCASEIPSGFLVASIGTCSVLGPNFVSDGLILFPVSGVSKPDVTADLRADEDLRNL